VAARHYTTMAPAEPARRQRRRGEGQHP